MSRFGREGIGRMLGAIGSQIGNFQFEILIGAWLLNSGVREQLTVDSSQFTKQRPRVIAAFVLLALVPRYVTWHNPADLGGSLMRIDDIEWTLDRFEHIARHAVVPEEVEEVFASAPVFRRGRGGVYEAWGQTESGRYLLVIFRYLGHNRAWPITARDMDENEKRLFRKK